MLGVDIAILAVIAISAVLSLLRGMIREVLSLVAWVAAFWVARTYNPAAASWIGSWVTLPSAQWVLGFGLLFVGTLLAMGVVNFLLCRIVVASGLTATDRVLGIAFGILRGVAVVTFLVFLASFTS